MVGEIWVDLLLLLGGFWVFLKYIEIIFYVWFFKFNLGEVMLIMVEFEFFRIGLLGIVIEGKVFVFGLYEDWIR